MRNPFAESCRRRAHAEDGCTTIVAVASGKGGTGTTTVAAALAHLGSQEPPVALADADCKAANLELVLEATKLEEHEFWSGKRLS
jgi:MinD superfamily P-loop ATPase